MRLTHLTIKNFKGIDERVVRIDFAPITMLFGPNNAGKSTVIQALHLAREVLCHGNPDPDRVEGGGESINLGGFKEFVHKHDLSRDVTLGLGIDLGDEDLPIVSKREEMLWKEIQAYYQETDAPEDTYLESLWNSAQNVINSLGAIEVQFTISWGVTLEKPFISKYAIYTEPWVWTICSCKEVCINRKLKRLREKLDNSLALQCPSCNEQIVIKRYDPEAEKVNTASIQCDENGVQTFYGLDFSIFIPLEERDDFKKCIQSWRNSETVENHGQFDLMEKLDDLIDKDRTWETISPGSTGPNGRNPYQPKVINPQVRGCALPLWDCPLDLSETVDSSSDSDIALCTFFLSTLMIGPALMLRSFFQKRLQYIGPLRQIPPRNFMAEKTPGLDRWANGLAAWDMLTMATNPQLDIVNKWLDILHSPKPGYTVHHKKLLPLNKDILKNLDEMAASQLREIFNPPFETRLIIHTKQSGTEVSPHDMGVGISQIIPVVVAGALAKPNTLIAVEQPELHIHPAWQTDLGDLFLKAICQDDPPMFLLETHSEHLMLRLLRRVRETGEGELPADFPPIKPEMISVLYVQTKEGGGTEITHLPITPDGDFSRKWPKGFFTERAEEIF